MKPPRLFVTGTDTNIGKTEVSCALLELLARAGMRPAAFKPYESGGNSDSRRLWEASGRALPLAQVNVHRFRPAVAPGVAAARSGVQPSWAETLRGFHRFDGRALVVEGAGGLFVPLDDHREVMDLVVSLELPVVLVARAGLGTLNHVALSLEALAARRIPVLAVVLVQSGKKRDASVRDNPAWLMRRHRLPVLGPVPWTPSAARRRQAFMRALSPLVDALLLRAPTRRSLRGR
jgi:dethiobiotin synthetase